MCRAVAAFVLGMIEVVDSGSKRRTRRDASELVTNACRHILGKKIRKKK